ncbi:hypothetical protein LINGRAHAP2_LOCUS35909 [Linum grandiflorum]
MDISAGNQQQQQFGDDQGHRNPPPPLNIINNRSCNDQRRRPGPVIVYEKSPEIIHVEPREFMGLVQRLTGKQDQTT